MGRVNQIILNGWYINKKNRIKARAGLQTHPQVLRWFLWLNHNSPEQVDVEKLCEMLKSYGPNCLCESVPGRQDKQ